ncbi:MAG: flagellar biosynthetic protein FliR [Alphaproteobacteria bacterium]|nr:MAG: flagellar biosynthetic protein FliR [Alphaproteobacteria bacterium]
MGAVLNSLPLAELLVFPFFLLVTRVGAAMMVFPAISDPSINVRARLLVVMGTSFILFPLLSPQLPALPALAGDMMLLMFGELVIGILLGLGARLMMAAMTLAGELIAFMAGFQGASLFDPSSNTNTGAPAIFLTLCASVVLLGLGLHHQLILAIVESYNVFKPGVLPDVGDVSAAFVQMMALITQFGLQLAAPIVVAGILTNALFGVLNRLVPQLQIFFVGVPVSMTIGVLILVAALGSMLQLWATATQSKLTLFQVESE